MHLPFEIRITRLRVYDGNVPETKSESELINKIVIFLYDFIISSYNFENRCGNRLKRKSCLFRVR